MQNLSREKNRERGLPLSQKYGNISSVSLDDMRKMYKMKEYENILLKYTFPEHPSSDGYYHVNIRDLSKKRKYRQVKAKTYEDLAMKIIDIELGYDSHASPATMTFKKVFEIVLEEKLRYVKDEERRASVMNTLSRLKYTYKIYFKDTWFEELPIDEITSKHIEKICLYNLERNQLKPIEFASLKSAILAVMKHAYQEHWIQDNPYYRVNFTKYKDMMVPPTRAEDRMYPEETVQKFLQYLRWHEEKYPKKFAAFALELQILIGGRRAEIPPLQWTDIKDTHLEIKKELLSVRDENDHLCYKLVHHTKTNKDRVFPLTAEVRDFLIRLIKNHQKLGLQSEWLFPDLQGRWLGTVTGTQTYSIYRKACSVLGIKNKYYMGPHSFRRNGITKVMNKTGNAVLASKLYGNSPIIAEKHYYAGIDIDQALEALR